MHVKGELNMDEPEIPGRLDDAAVNGLDGKTYLTGTNTELAETRQREEQYRALSETVPVGIVQINEAGTIVFSNPLFKAYCGRDGAEEAGEELLAKFCDAYAGFPGVPCKFETEFVVPGSSTRSVIVISSGWRATGSGKPSAIVSVVDVSEMTELRRINEDVRRLNRELADNMKRLKAAQDELVNKGRMEQLGQLTATIAHELRNPLGAVRTSAYLLERKVKDKGLGVESQLERINKGIVRCDNIITQLLDFSRTKQLNCQAADLDSWLGHIVEEEAKRLPSVLAITCSLGLAGREAPFDPSRLQRAIVNLLNNASEALVGQGDDPAKFTNPEPQLSISTYIKDGGVVIEVADNGPGIPTDVMTRIREPLFTTKSFGTGLGVPEIEQIAMQHGGRLDIHSNPGNGASFAVWLPLAKIDAAAEKAA